MNCDTCNKLLAENDTHEHILCTNCFNAQEKIHCMRCKCITRAHKVFARIKTFIKKQKRFVLVLVAVAIILAIIAAFKPLIVSKILIGMVVLPLTVAILFCIFALLTFGPIELGRWICKQFNWHMVYIDGERWAIGFFAYTLPFIFYGVGYGVFWFFSKK